MGLTELLIQQATAPLAEGLDAVAANAGVRLGGPLDTGPPSEPPVNVRINAAVSGLAGVPDYAAVAGTKTAMQNENLKNRVEALSQLYNQLLEMIATIPTLQPLQDQVDSLTNLMQALSISTSTTAVSARGVGATAAAALTASGTSAVADPAGRPNTQLQLTDLLLKANTLPTVADLSTTLTVTATVGSTTTPVLTKTIVLAALPAVGNVLDVLGNNGTTTAVYIPTGATLKVSASKGNFDFTLLLGIVAPAAN